MWEWAKLKIISEGPPGACRRERQSRVIAQSLGVG
jgi:hypothetical protein